MTALLFHVTLRENLPGIFRDGLVPQVGPRSDAAGESSPAIYCFPTWADCEQALLTWLGDEFEDEVEDDVVVVRVDVPASTPRTSDVEFEVALLGPVPARCIAGVTDTEGNDIDFTKYAGAAAKAPRRSRSP